MGIVARLRGRRPGTTRRASSADEEHLRDWARARPGVEAYLEPRTTVTETTLVLVAVDGSWTRRRVAGLDAARKLGKALKVPVYEVEKVGYPQRMRDHDARERVRRRREQGREQDRGSG